MMHGMDWLGALAAAAAAVDPVNANPPPAGLTGLFRFADRTVEAWLAFLDWLGRLFAPVMRPLFTPVNAFLAQCYMPWAKICAVGLFVAAMVWVCFLMDESYVNLGRTKKSIWTDLRWWTILSMLPHVFVYLYF